jgi:hypothetical protein
MTPMGMSLVVGFELLKKQQKWGLEPTNWRFKRIYRRANIQKETWRLNHQSDAALEAYNL